ncbi:MAG: hypothetical protein M1827_001998 [Pycnora praestabilis]|nr:MAG: hypothetical protein M1827_001998 [Pycnora praestabilis]
MSLIQNANVLHGTTDHNARVEEQSVTTVDGRRRSLNSQPGALASLVRLVRDPIGVVGSVVEGLRDAASDQERVSAQVKENRRQIIQLRLREATSYEEWRLNASELDMLEGNDDWKDETDSSEYDRTLVEGRLKQLDEARISCDVGRMLFLIRTALTRGLGDMGNIKLYKHSHIGTKSLIERYISSALETLRALLEISGRDSREGLESKCILDQILAARQAFGRSALLLSGGATFGMNHIGVLKALWEARLLPRIISGASAGSIVCAVMCTRTDEEIPELLHTFCHGDLAVFEENGNEDGILRRVARFLKSGALFDISHLTRVMTDLLGDMTFQEAYNRTRRILNICVSSASLYELPRLLNYITAPNVLIRSAVAASCSVPFIFSAASLLAKDPKTAEIVPWNPSPQRWIDGSVDNDLPMTRLAELFNVNHFIVSQVNPHVVPFLAKDDNYTAAEAQQESSIIPSGPGWILNMTYLAKAEALHRMHVLAEMGIFPNYVTKVRSVLSQKYSGDITIFPDISYADFPRLLKNPSTQFMLRAMTCGEKATWPKLSRIRNHCAIELALDDAVQKLRTRVVFSPSQTNLRLKISPEHRRTSSNHGGESQRKRGSRERRRNSRNPEHDATAAQATVRVRRDLADPAHLRNNNTDLNAEHQIPDANLGFLSFKDQPLPHNGQLSQSAPTPNLNDQSISSGAETSTSPISDSDYEDSQSSSTEVPSPPHLSTLWPTPRQLFPYASYPATPSSDNFSPLATSAPTLLATKSENISPVTPPASTLLAMTPSTARAEMTAPSSPERKYKRLFHPPAPVQQASGIEPSSNSVMGLGLTDAGTGNVSGNWKPRSRRNSALELDISGTRGMVLRKKSIAKLYPPDVVN